MKKLLRSFTPVKAPVLGLDVHRRLIVFCLLAADGEIVKEGKIAARRDDLAEVLGAVGVDGHVVLEACGVSMWVYDVLVARFGKERVHVAQSARIRAIANSSEKNDANDAFWLAYLTHEGRLPEAYVPPALYRELRVATRERIEAVKMRVRAAVRLKGELAQIGAELPFESLDCEATRERVSEIGRDLGGARGAKIAECLDTYDHFTQLRDGWAQRIKEMVAKLPAIKTLADVMPGIGETLSATILAETGPVERFSSAKALGRYTGLTPSDRSTGGKQIHGHITREGSSALRWALIEGVTHCVRSREGARGAVGAWVRARGRRLGRAKARAAAARKLAEGIWRLFRLGECFDPAKPFGGEPVLEDAKA